MSPAKHQARREARTQAQHSAAFVVQHLREMLHHATSVESIIIMRLIHQAAAVETELANLASAIECDADSAGKL